MASSYIPLLGDLSPLMSFFGWWFLPGLLSGIVLGLFYRVLPSWRPSAPSTTTTTDERTSFNPLYELQKIDSERRSRLHRTVAHGFVISVYLLYNLMNIYRQQDGSNYYSILGLRSNSISLSNPNMANPNSPITTSPSQRNASRRSKSKKSAAEDNENNASKGYLDEAALKSHWRKLARAFHPDKLNPPPQLQSDEDISKWRDAVQAKFIGMREAYETLSDDAKQWAYDRFGPSIVDWKSCVTMREYLIEGLKHSAPFWVFTIASLSLIGSLRKSDPGSFWRLTCLGLILVSEFIIITSSRSTTISRVLGRFFPNRAPFQQIELLRQVFIASSSITTQLSSILYPTPTRRSDDGDEDKRLREVLDPMFGLVEKINETCSLGNLEVIKLIFNDLHPVIKSDEKVVGDEKVKGKDKDLIDGKGVDDVNEKEEEEGERIVKEMMKDLKEKMLDTFCDLKFQSESIGQEAWISAIKKT